MSYFSPQRVLIEEGALDYQLGQEIEERYQEQGVPIRIIESHNRVKWEEEMSPAELYERAKETLVVGVKKTLKFNSCQPSADYRLVTSTSCPGRCEYCYLATNLGPAVYVRVYVNLDQILKAVRKHIKKSEKKITTFEASSSSDPVAVEHITGSLKRIIEFFASRDDARLRLATKFTNVDSLLDLDHRGRTKFRFSINANYVIDNFEANTPNLQARIEAAKKIEQAQYPLGFMIAPIMIFDNWKKEYQQLIQSLAASLEAQSGRDLSFELITFRFSTRAQNLITKRHPETKLDFNKEERRHKGFGKYVYQEQEMEEVNIYFQDLIQDYFPEAKIEYLT